MILFSLIKIINGIFFKNDTLSEKNENINNKKMNESLELLKQDFDDNKNLIKDENQKKEIENSINNLKNIILKNTYPNDELFNSIDDLIIKIYSLIICVNLECRFELINYLNDIITDYYNLCYEMYLNKNAN
jgi:hypothetical protein